MANATKKITLASARDIPFDKLSLSQANVRRIKAGISVEELAESIARRGLIQSLHVRPLLDEAGAETGRYEVPAGGRRFRALELLVRPSSSWLAPPGCRNPFACRLVFRRMALTRFKLTRPPRMTPRWPHPKPTRTASPQSDPPCLGRHKRSGHFFAGVVEGGERSFGTAGSPPQHRIEAAVP